MSETAAGVLFIASLILALALAYRPLGDYLVGVLTPARHSRVERGIYRLVGVDPQGEQSLGGVRAQRAGVLGWSRCCSSTGSSGCRTICGSRSACRR